MLARLSLLLLLPSLAAAYPGDADPLFGGGDGIAFVDFAPLAGGTATHASPLVAVDRADRVLVAASIFGMTTGAGVARLLADGTPDSSFGENGRVLIAPSSFGRLIDLHVDAQDRAVLAMHVGFGPAQVWRVCRLTPTGALDPTFFGGGCATASPGPGATLTDLVEQPNGNLWAIGRSSGTVQGLNRQGVALAQFDLELQAVRTDTLLTVSGNLLPNRAIPYTFGEGVIMVGSYLVPEQTTPQSDVAVMFAGYGNGSFSIQFNGTIPFDRGDSNNDEGVCIARDSSGRPLIGVAAARTGGKFWATMRLTQNLALDTTYGPNVGFEGRTLENVGQAAVYGAQGSINQCVRTADDVLNLAGSFTFPDPHAMGQNSTIPAVMRIRAPGFRDSPFGGSLSTPTTDYDPTLMASGVAMHYYRPPGQAYPRFDTAESIAATSDNDLVIAGYSYGDGGDRPVAVMKLHADTVFADRFE